MPETRLIEQIPEDFPLETVTQAGAGMMAVGLVGLVLGIARGRRGGATRTASALVLICGAAAAGAVFLLQRQVRIEETEDEVKDALSGLDPVARAQVLKAVAQEEFGFEEE
jgi:hypothetical protein